MLDNSPEARQKRRGESQYTLKLKARQATCQVTGCLTELPNKAYHQRYRICQTHAAMPQMVLDGRHVRFCQHCGRFQALQEFDNSFKSCRKSLQRHRNSQSRRIRTKSSTKASSGSDDISGGATATKIPRTRRNTYHSSSFNDSGDSNNDDTQSPYDGSTPGGSGVQNQSAEGSLGGGLDRQQCGGSSNGLVPMFGFPPGAAEEIYSALNSIPTRTNDGVAAAAAAAAAAPNQTTTGVGIHPSMPPPAFGIHSGVGPLPIVPSTNMVAREPVNMDPVPMDLMPIHDLYDDTNPSDWIPNLESGADGYLEPAAPRLAPLPSFTAAETAVAGRYGGGGSARAMASLLGAHERPTTSTEPLGDVPHSSLDAALNLLTFEYPNTLGEAHDGSTVMRASLKLFNTQPEYLPLTVREALIEVMATSDTFLTANQRPGCVHITANVVLKRSEAQALETMGAKGLLTGALAQGPSLIPPESLEGPRAAFLAQVNTQIAARGASGAIASVSIDASSDTSSDIRAVVPLAMTPADPQQVTLLGRSISGDLDMVVCRRGEDTPDLGVWSSGPSQRLQESTMDSCTTISSTRVQDCSSEASGSGTSSQREPCSFDGSASESGSQSSFTPRRTSNTASITAPSSLPCTWYPPNCFTGRGLAAGEYVQFSLMEVKEGLHNIEIQKGSMLSPNTQSLLVIDDAAVVSELRQLEVDATGVADIPAFVQAVGVVVDHLKLRRVGRHPNGSIAVAQRIAPLAAAIVTTAIARRWPALLRLICPAACPADVQASITSLSTTNTNDNNASNSSSDPLALLHLVAASGCVELVEALEEWGTAAGHIWLCQPVGRAHITPLHIAAILDDDAAMARALTKLFGVSGHRCWYYSKGADGVTPAQAAKISSNEAVLQFLTNTIPRVSVSLYDDDSTCSSLYTTTGSVAADMSLSLSGGFIGLDARKYSSTSYEDVPPCPDEWPYSTFYGTNGLLQSSTSTNTSLLRNNNNNNNNNNNSTDNLVAMINRTGLSVVDNKATAVGVALGFITGIGALAVRFLYGVQR